MVGRHVRTGTPTPDLDASVLSRVSTPAPDFVLGARNQRFVHASNAIPIRSQRTPTGYQPLPAFPARVKPIPFKAMQQARDNARFRRQLPVDIAVTNYTWKSKSKV